MISQLIQDLGLIEVIVSAFSAVLIYIGNKIKAAYERNIQDTEKERIVKTVVKAVDQLYKDLDGPERYELAVENIVEMLNEKKICNCTELEIKMLIEAAVKDLKISFK